MDMMLFWGVVASSCASIVGLLLIYMIREYFHG